MGKFIITEDERKHIMSLYEQSALWDYSPAKLAYNTASTLWDYSPAKLAYNTAKDLDLEFLPPAQMAYQIATKLTIDDWINLTSAALDVIPGIGWVASASIDVGHAISYAARYYKSTTDEDKIKNSVSAIFTLGMTVIPVGGNIANIIMNKGVSKSITNLTPVVIKKILGMKVGFNLTKPAWKYCLFTFLLKFSEGKIDDFLISVKKCLTEISSKYIPGLLNNSVLLNLANLIGDLSDISKEVKNYGNPDYTEINKIIQL